MNLGQLSIMGVYCSPSFASQGINNNNDSLKYFYFSLDSINLISLKDTMAECILDLASNEQEATIIVGDFNMDPQKRPTRTKYQHLSQGYMLCPLLLFMYPISPNGFSTWLSTCIIR